MFSLFFMIAMIIAFFAILKFKPTGGELPALEEELREAKAAYNDDPASNHHRIPEIENLKRDIKEVKKASLIKIWGKRGALAASFVLLVTAAVNTSLVFVPDNTTAHFTRIWGGSALQEGELIATTPLSTWAGGTKGPQSETIRPGTHFRFLINIFNQRATPDQEQMLHVPPGTFAVLKAKAGVPMTGDRMVAPPWSEQEFTSMLEDAGYFLTNGGMRGVQYTVVPSGSYHINNFLWELEGMHPEAQITTGEVAVVRANVTVDPEQDCTATDSSTAVPLVPQGCRGVWDQEYGQGTYRFNPFVLEVSRINVRQVNNDHRGGYTRKNISFTTDSEGNIQSRLTDERVDQGDAIDDAIDIRAEGWNIDQDVSVLWQVIDPPRAVAQLGNQDEVAEFISRITQSQFRIVAQGNDINECITDISTGAVDEACAEDARMAMDLIYERDQIENDSLALIQADIDSYGIRVNNVVMSRPNIPPELLMPVLRTQYANNMEQTYIEEEKTAQRRIAVNNANELANRQAILVEADLQNQAANERALQIVTLAEAQKEADVLTAQGQEAIMTVVGQDNVQAQIQLQKILDFAAACGGDCIRQPQILVNAQGGSGLGGNDTAEMATLAAILGNSTLTQAVDQFQGRQRPVSTGNDQ